MVVPRDVEVPAPDEGLEEPIGRAQVLVGTVTEKRERRHERSYSLVPMGHCGDHRRRSTKPCSNCSFVASLRMCNRPEHRAGWGPLADRPVVHVTAGYR